jgi:hypothetical protein
MRTIEMAITGDIPYSQGHVSPPLKPIPMTFVTLWQTNMAMEHGPSSNDL